MQAQPITGTGQQGTAVLGQARIAPRYRADSTPVQPTWSPSRKVIPADPQRLFDIVADPAMHPLIDGSGSVRGQRAGAPERLSSGATFGMDMKLGAPYKITNTVVEFEEGRRIAWRHFNGHVWRYIFEPVDGGTKVTEQWDARPAKNRLLLRLLGFPKRNRAGMLATLDGSTTSPTSVAPNRAAASAAQIGGQGTGGQSPHGSGAGRRRAAGPPAAGCGAPRARSAAR